MLTVTMGLGQQVTITANPIDQPQPPGNPGLIAPGSVPVWTANPAGLTLTPAADGLTCVVSTPSGAVPGTFLANIQGGSSNGANINGQFTVNVAENPAASFAPTAGPVTNIGS
jgi:hypothetical protein